VESFAVLLQQTTAATVPQTAPLRIYSHQSTEVYANLFTGTEVRRRLAPLKFVPIPEFTVVSVRGVQLSGTDYSEKCHLRMVQVDPAYDSKIRIRLPADQIENAKIRVIAPPRCHR
jgi:hypothetical protein